MIPPAGFKNQPTIDFDTRTDRWDIPKDQHLANGCTVGIGVTTQAFRITEGLTDNCLNVGLFELIIRLSAINVNVTLPHGQIDCFIEIRKKNIRKISTVTEICEQTKTNKSQATLTGLSR